MKNLLYTFFVVVLIQVSACQQEDLYSPSVDTKEYLADFMINNNSDQDIRVTYVTSSKLGFRESDGYILIPKGSTQRIFDVTFITEKPYPSSALYTLSFYQSIGNNNEKVNENKRVMDEAWEVIDQVLDEDGYGYTQYQLSYTDVSED